MAGADRRSTGTDRRASTRISMTQQDDDDYDLEAMGISDGFRPAAAMTGHNRMASQGSQSNASGRRTPPRPSSTAKPTLDSFALRHDGGMGPIGRNNSVVASHSNSGPTRSSTVSTDMGYVRAESPYQGPSGPSHPYQMYPQESRMARTMSVATTSTVQVPDRPYNGPGGPTHPYGMYPQNIAPEGEAAAEGASTPPVPVGFPGLNNNYERRLGPDGEEIADIIGPDGHTEQLPPYTQYPDEAFARKTRPTVQVPPLAGAGGIGLATRNPEFESQEDLNTPQSRQSTRSMMSDSTHQINMAAATISEKPPLKKWQIVAKRKVCGIVPIWAIVLAGVVFVLFAIILGTVLAILKPRHPQKHYRPDADDQPQSITVVSTMTTTFDATPFTTVPVGLPTLPTGTFALPISAPSTIQAGCILNTAMSTAWTCTIPMTSYTIAIEQVIGSNNNLNNNEVNLSLGNNTFGGYYPYGTQPPILNRKEVLNLVTDSQEPSRGPAWFFELPYNKLVILPEYALTATSNSKRDVEERGAHSPGDFMQRKNVAEPGDKPWFCYWNGTLLEAFIYVNLTSSAGRTASATSSASASSTWGQRASSTYGANAPAATTAQAISSSSGDSEQMVWPIAYPKVLKIEERRIPRGAQSIAPYCIQHIIDPYGNAQQYLNSTGQPVTIYLNESEPSAVSQISGKRSSGDLAERQNANSCGCVWLWT